MPTGVIVVPTLTSSAGLKKWVVQLAVSVGRRERERETQTDRERSKLS